MTTQEEEASRQIKYLEYEKAEAASEVVRVATNAIVVDHVEGITLKNGKFQTVAVLDDGSRVIIRASATRPYLNAYRHRGDCLSSAKAPLGRHFRLGKTPSRDHDDLVEAFKIQYK